MTPDEKKLHARDQRLRKTYHITLEDRAKIAAEQGNRCGICGRLESEFTGPLQVDHEHFKIEYRKGVAGAKWSAEVRLKDGRFFCGLGITKDQAKQRVAAQALPASVRGLLCPGRHGRAWHGTCNRLLGRVDDAKWLRAAIAYLENPPARKVLVTAPEI